MNDARPDEDRRPGPGGEAFTVVRKLEVTVDDQHELVEGVAMEGDAVTRRDLLPDDSEADRALGVDGERRPGRRPVVVRIVDDGLERLRENEADA